MRRDLKQELDCYRGRPGELRVLEIPPQQYVAVEGHGDPNTSPRWAEAVGALFPVAYALRHASRTELGRDHVVMPLEALWWAEDMASFTSRRDKESWQWTAMILVPDWISSSMLEEAVARVAARREPTRLGDVRWLALHEGRCVQTLHVGPFDDEAEVLARMHDVFLPAQGLRPSGRHHEIYLSDVRRTAPARLRTLLRQPVETA